MSLDDVLKAGGVSAMLAGVGLAALAPLLLRGADKGGRPLAKKLLHKYLDMADAFKELSAETHEQWRDLLAEVQAERTVAQGTDAEPAQDVTSAY